MKGVNIIELVSVMIACVGTLGGFFSWALGRVLKQRIDDAVLKGRIDEHERRLHRIEKWMDNQ